MPMAYKVFKCLRMMIAFSERVLYNLWQQDHALNDITSLQSCFAQHLLENYKAYEPWITGTQQENSSNIKLWKEWNNSTIDLLLYLASNIFHISIHLFHHSSISKNWALSSTNPAHFYQQDCSLFSSYTMRWWKKPQRYSNRAATIISERSAKNERTATIETSAEKEKTATTETS